MLQIITENFIRTLLELQRIFQKIDKDSNGKLNHYELKFLLKSLRQFVMEREMMDIMKEADVNRTKNHITTTIYTIINIYVLQTMVR